MNKHHFQTSDLGWATFISLCFPYQIEFLDDSKKAVFVFDPESGHEKAFDCFSQQYWTDEYLVSARQYLLQLKSLKTRLFEASNELATRSSR